MTLARALDSPPQASAASTVPANKALFRSIGAIIRNSLSERLSRPVNSASAMPRAKSATSNFKHSECGFNRLHETLPRFMGFGGRCGSMIDSALMQADFSRQSPRHELAAEPHLVGTFSHSTRVIPRHDCKRGLTIATLLLHLVRAENVLQKKQVFVARVRASLCNGLGNRNAVNTTAACDRRWKRRLITTLIL